MRDSLTYRRISITSSVHKVYCPVLNYRLGSWSEDNCKMFDDENGFRKKRSNFCNFILSDHINCFTVDKIGLL